MSFPDLVGDADLVVDNRSYDDTHTDVQNYEDGPLACGSRIAVEFERPIRADLTPLNSNDDYAVPVLFRRVISCLRTRSELRSRIVARIAAGRS